MRKLIISTLLLVASITSYSADRYWVAMASGSWNLSTNWSATSGGPGGASVPGANDVAIFNSGSVGCMLVGNTSVGGITMSGYTGQLNMGGFTLTLTGTNSLATGTLTSGTVSFNNATSVTFSGTQFSCIVSGSASQVLFNGSTFSTSVTITKTGSTNDTGTGGNTFNGNVSIINAGTGSLILTNTNTDRFFNGATFTSSNGNIAVAYGGSASFQGNIIVNNSSTGTISFGQNGGYPLLASGSTISVGTGFSSGTLQIKGLEQQGTTTQTLTLTGTASLIIDTCPFSGTLNATAPSLQVIGSNFLGGSVLEKTGSGTNNWPGSTTFSGTTTITNSGSGTLNLGTTLGDTFNGATTFNNNGSGTFGFAYSHSGATTFFLSSLTLNSNVNTGTNVNSFLACHSGNCGIQVVGTVTINVGGTVQSNVTFLNGSNSTAYYDGDFNINISNTHPNTTVSLGANGTLSSYSGDITLGNTATTLTTGGVFFGSSAVWTSSTLASGKTVKLHAVNGFQSGNISFTNFTQSGSQPIILNASNTSTLTFGSIVTLGGNVTASAGRVFLNGTNFNGTVNITKTGAGSDESAGGNVFRGNTVITNNGTGDLNLGNSSLDQFRASTTFNNNGNSGGSGVIRVAKAHASQTTTFSTDLTINTNQTSTNATGYSYLFAQASSAAVSVAGPLTINLGGSSLSSVGFSATGASTRLSGDVTVNLSNATANNYVEFGQNTGTVQLDGNVTLASSVTTSSSGVHFRNTNLASTKTIAASAATGFPAVIRFTNFTQSGNAPLSFTTTPATVQGVFITGSTFGGDFTSYSPDLDVQNSIFNGTTYFEKTGGGGTFLSGGNTFNGSTTFFNSSASGPLAIANTTGDTYNGNVTFSRASGSANILPAYVGTNTFRGNIATGGDATVGFGSGGGTVVMAGSGITQTISGNGSSSPTVARLTINTSGGGAIQLLTALFISNSAQFVSGNILSSASNPLSFQIGATASGASSASFVDGNVTKRGTQAFTFPVGSGSSFRPISISAPATLSNFEARFFRGMQTYGNQSTYSSPIVGVNGCEYWTLNRISGSASVSVTLSWNSAECTGPYITDPSTLLVGRWNGTNWVSHGNGGTTGNVSAGTITTAAAVTSFSPFIIATSSTTNPLPITLLYFKAESESESTVLSWKTATEINNAEFQVERSADGRRFDVIGRVPGAGSSRTPNSYSLIDHHPLPGVSYYRLKQVDFDGTSTTFDIVRVNNTERQIDFYVYPNPAAGGTVVRTNYAGPAELIDQYGLTVARFESATQISTAQIPTGVYVLRNGQGQTFRLIVVNPM